MTRWATFLLVAATLGGCVQAEDLQERILPGREIPERWEASVEPSMAPDFTGAGPSYPVMLVHQHHVPSARQQEEARRNPVVCFLVAGAPAPLAALPRSSMEACMGPAADPPTGRLFLDEERYLAEGGRAVAVLMGSCSGGALVLGDARTRFEVQAPGHTFEVRLLPNGTFRVDGRWVPPGSALKVGYFLHAGDPQDEEYVRVVFDAPGRWLLSRMDPDDGDLGRVRARPDQGTGLVAEVAVAPADLATPLQALVDATPGTVTGVAALRAVHDGERLTDLTLRLLTDAGAVTWYGAGRVDDRLVLLGAEEGVRSDDARVDVETVLETARLGWADLRGSDAPISADVRLDPSTTWSSHRGTSLGVDRALVPGGCEGGCVFVRQGGSWARLLVAERGAATDAATLEVLRGGGTDGGSVWWSWSSATPKRP